MAEWTKVSWKRVGITLLVLYLSSIAVFVIMRAVDSQLAPRRYAKMLELLEPCNELVPRPVPDGSIATLSGQRIVRFGYSLQLPWREPGSEFDNESSVILVSKRGQSVILRNPSDRFDTYRVLYSALSTSLAHTKDQIEYNNFSLLTTAMETKPDEVKWWNTRKQNARLATLLMIKSLTLVGCSGPLYSVKSPLLRGFQQGNPSKGPVRLDLFDRADHHYSILIYDAAKPTVITQSEINEMIASIVPIS